MSVKFHVVNLPHFAANSVFCLAFDYTWTWTDYIHANEQCYRSQLKQLPQRVDIMVDLRTSAKSPRYGVMMLFTQTVIHIAPNVGKVVIVCDHTTINAFKPIIQRKYPSFAQKLHTEKSLERALNYLAHERGLFDSNSATV